MTSGFYLHAIIILAVFWFKLGTYSLLWSHLVMAPDEINKPAVASRGIKQADTLIGWSLEEANRICLSFYLQRLPT